MPVHFIVPFFKSEIFSLIVTKVFCSFFIFLYRYLQHIRDK